MKNINTVKAVRQTLREERPYSEFFWSVFSRIRTEHGEIRSTSLYSVQMQGNTDQKISEQGHFSRSQKFLKNGNRQKLLTILENIRILGRLFQYFFIFNIMSCTVILCLLLGTTVLRDLKMILVNITY